MLKQGNRAITKVLVQWTNGYPEDATWEKLSHLQQLFPEVVNQLISYSKVAWLSSTNHWMMVWGIV